MAAGLVTMLIALLILAIGPAETASTWRTYTALVFWTLTPILLLVAPGMFVVLHRPSPGISLATTVGERFAHPRLAGLAMVWCGLVLAADLVIANILPFCTSSGCPPSGITLIMMVTLAIGFVASIPVIALLIFDRRR